MKLFTAAIGKRLLESDNRQQPLRGADDEIGMCCNFKKQQESDWLGRPDSVSCSHPDQLVDELNLPPDIQTVHLPSRSSTSRNESEYRRYARTAQTIRSGSLCRHLKIAGRIVFSMISSGYPAPAAKVATQPFERIA